MILPIALMLAAPAVAGSMESVAVSFEQLPELGGEIIANARAEGAAARQDQAQAPKAKASLWIGLHKKVHPAFQRWERDCVHFVFEPKDRESEAVWLTSTEYVEECTYDERGLRRCWEVPRFRTRARVQVRIPQRQEPYPWEREVFEMCLEGNWLTFDDIRPAFDYDARFIDRTGIVELKPKKKIPTDPDPDGIRVESFGLDAASGHFLLTLSDRWAIFYQGEKTVLKVALKKKVFLGSQTLFEGEFSLDPAERYVVRFADLAGQFKSQPKEGDRCFVAWSFRRIGKISKDRRMEGDNSPVVEFRKLRLAAR